MSENQQEEIDYIEFKETLDEYNELVLTIESHQWRQIRSGNYWEECDALPSAHAKRAFTIKRIKLWNEHS